MTKKKLLEIRIYEKGNKIFVERKQHKMLSSNMINVIRVLSKEQTRCIECLDIDNQKKDSKGEE